MCMIKNSHRAGSSAPLSMSHVKSSHCMHRQHSVQAQDRQACLPPGVPTTLLVLALLFFGAAAVLAVCYVKR